MRAIGKVIALVTVFIVAIALLGSSAGPLELMLLAVLLVALFYGLPRVWRTRRS